MDNQDYHREKKQEYFDKYYEILPTLEDGPGLYERCYNEVERWHIAKYGFRKYKTYQSFKIIKYRNL